MADYRRSSPASLPAQMRSRPFRPMLIGLGLVLGAVSLVAQEAPPATEAGVPPGVSRAVTPPAIPSDAPDQRPAVPGAPTTGVSAPTPNTVHPNVFEYFRVTGTDFNTRDSATGYVYDGVGCIHRTAGTGFFSVPVHLPGGATVQFVRFFYNNVVAGDAGTVYLTKYNGAGSITDMGGTPSTSTLGFGQSLSAQLSEVVDNADLGYVLNWIPPASANQICGVRIAYYPGQTGVFTPVPPCRVFDTRVAGPQTTGSPLANPGPYNFRIQGNCGIPNGATAVALNATVVTPSAAGDLRLFPAGGAQPPVSVSNYPAGIGAIANGALTPLAAVVNPDDKDLSVLIGMSGSGTIHLLIDVTGYYY